MWLKQTLRWCTITGALMLATVCATYLHKQVAADPQGVETRWWDGTKKVEETYYPNGKVMTRTEFGDDGKTIITFREYDFEGNIRVEKIRLQDGNVVESQYYFDGKKPVLMSYTLWMGDMQKFLITRMFWQDGSMRQEVVNTDDGLIPRHSRMWDQKGRLIQENQILQNAANQMDTYEDGKLSERQTLFGTGDLVTQNFRPNGTMSKEEKVIKLTGNTEHTYFDDKGKPIFGGEQWPDGTQITVLYKNGVLAIKHTVKQFVGLRSVEEVSANGKVTRKLVFDAAQRPSVVYLYRGDGTLAREKHLRGEGNSNDIKVVKQLDYDATGKKVVGESDSGEPEKFDADVLDTPKFRGSTLRGLQR